MRPWRDSDLAPFAKMNADPRVRRFFSSLLTHKESDASVEHFRQSYEREGFCFFAAELRATEEFIGFIGIERMSFPLPRVPRGAVEIGWRLTPEVWGHGLATEGARAVLEFAFRKVRLPEVVAIAVPANLPSRRVMEKLGMTHDPRDDFDHPKLADGHPLQRHVLYRVQTAGLTAAT
ncbi:MAG: GNAT family N-acetyltransferase [Acidobacteriaceae bacterium]